MLDQLEKIVFFNKNSLINDYKNELDYYENAKTPWWYENY